MFLRCWSGAALAWIGLISGAAIHSQPLLKEDPRLLSWKLAPDAIQETGTRAGIPDFVTWLTAREIYPCQDAPAKPRALRDLFDESFHYNPKTAARMCGPLTGDPASPPMDRALDFWEHSNPTPSMIDPPFPNGARLGAAFWNAVRLPADPTQGKLVELQTRSGNQTVTRRIRITIPERARAGSAACGPPSGKGAPAMPGVQDVSLDDFFSVRLAPGERYNGASCGDFAVLVAFHLVHKVRGRWLWTTFWWDPQSTEFGAARPRDFKGAGEHPRAWANYAMDASFDPNAVIFNPWRIAERTSNCARCHAEVTVHPDRTGTGGISFDSVTAAQSHFK